MFVVGQKVRAVDVFQTDLKPGEVYTIRPLDPRYQELEDRVSLEGIPDRCFRASRFEPVLVLPNPHQTTLPQDSAERKAYPLYRGLLRYFPAACAAVARVSKIGSDKHNPGEEMHHARSKSTDQEDCIMRHLTDLAEDFGKGVGRDENGIPQVDYIAWRALALCQIWHEKHDGAPMAPGAKP